MPWRVLQTLTGVTLTRLKISAVVLVTVVIAIAIPGVVYTVIPSASSSDGVPLPIYLGIIAVELLIVLIAWFVIEHELGRRQRIRHGQEVFAFRFPFLLSVRKAEALVNAISLEFLDGIFSWDHESMTLRYRPRKDVSVIEDPKALELAVARAIRTCGPKSAWLMLTHSFLDRQ